MELVTALSAGCPRCRGVVVEGPDGWACVDHGPIVPLWRPEDAAYDDFAQHLRLAGAFPTLLPWPMPPGWSITDFGVVTGRSGPAIATVTCVSGATELDGPVDLILVSEEVGVGLGARCAGLGEADPGREISTGRPMVRVRVGAHSVALWPISTSAAEGEFDRTVVIGEAAGRWLWVVLRPASAMLLLHDDWLLHDVSTLGAPLLELPFGGPPPPW